MFNNNLLLLENYYNFNNVSEEFDAANNRYVYRDIGTGSTVAYTDVDGMLTVCSEIIDREERVQSLTNSSKISRLGKTRYSSPVRKSANWKYIKRFNTDSILEEILSMQAKEIERLGVKWFGESWRRVQ